MTMTKSERTASKIGALLQPKIPILIKESNRDRIEALLKTTNGSATAHTTTTLEDLQAMRSRAAERLLDAGIPRQAWRGIQYTYEPAIGASHQHYHNTIITAVVIVRAAGGWALQSAQRRNIFGQYPGADDIYLTPAARNALNALWGMVGADGARHQYTERRHLADMAADGLIDAMQAIN